MNSDTPNSDTPVTVSTTPAPKDFYRLHTFKVKGPNRRETRDYLLSLGRVIPPHHHR